MSSPRRDRGHIHKEDTIGTIVDPVDHVATNFQGKRRLKNSKSAKESLERISKPLQRELVVKSLTVDHLRPLVELAYWSSFVEVRRDAAAAFATLSMNSQNLDVLSRAGVLGAVLGFLRPAEGEGAAAARPDGACARDALVALGYMVKRDDIKVRLCAAPGGLASAQALLRARAVGLRRAALAVVDHLAESPDITHVIMLENGILKNLFLQINHPHEILRRDACRIIRTISRVGKDPVKMYDEGIILFAINSLDYAIHAHQSKMKQKLDLNPDDPAFISFERLTVLEYLCALAAAPANRAPLAAAPRAAAALKGCLQAAALPAQHRLLAARALESLLGDPAAHAPLLREGLLGAVLQLAFNDVYPRLAAGPGEAAAAAQEKNSASASALRGAGGGGGGGGGRGGDPADPSAPGGGGGGSEGGGGGGAGDLFLHPRPDREAFRAALGCLERWVSEPGGAEEALRGGLLAYLDACPVLGDPVATAGGGGGGGGAFPGDPRVGRTAAGLVRRLCLAAAASEPTRQSLVAQGTLGLLQLALLAEDPQQKRAALAAAAALAPFPRCQGQLFLEPVLAEVLPLGYVQDEAPTVVIILEHASKRPKLHKLLLRLGLADLLHRLLAPDPLAATGGGGGGGGGGAPKALPHGGVDTDETFRSAVTACNNLCASEEGRRAIAQHGELVMALQHLAKRSSKARHVLHRVFPDPAALTGQHRRPAAPAPDGGGNDGQAPYWAAAAAADDGKGAEEKGEEEKEGRGAAS